MEQCCLGHMTTTKVVTAGTVATKLNSPKRETQAASAAAVRAYPTGFRVSIGIKIRQEYRTNIPLALIARVMVRDEG